MIKADFYPDFQTYSDNLVLTDYLYNLRLTSKEDDPLRAYYMGKLPNNKCRSLLWKDLKIVGTGDDKPNMTISLVADETRSMNWGYCLSDDIVPERMFWSSDGFYSWRCKLINSMQAYCLTTGGNVELFFMLLEFTDYTLDSGATIKGAGIFREDSPELTSREYVNWMENGTDLTLNFTDYGSITIKSQDCNENGIWELGDNKYIILRQVATNGDTRYTGMSSGSHINPFYCTTARSDNRFHAFSNLQRWALLNYRIRFTQDFSSIRLYATDTVWNWSESGANSGIVSKSRDISVSAEALDYARRQSQNTVTMFGDKQTIMVTRLSTTIDGKTFYQVEFEYNVMPNDAYFTYCLINKVRNGYPASSSVYTTSDSVGLFDASNVPTGKRASVTTYRELEPLLQQWQKYGYNINDDEFDPDTPQPRPDPGTDPDDDDEKDDAPDKQDWGDPMNPSNGFDIPYGFANYKAFNNAGIINFAERLWDAPDDFWEALTIANKNNANWLDYFISLRAYPYWINSTGEEANIYVGAGGQFYLGDEGTNLYASTPQHITFYVLNFSIDKYYNNFLDFSPYTKAYLYLPFSGTWEVNPKYLYHTSLQLLLKLDITDGSGVWQLIRSGADTAGSGYIILEKQCKIGVEIPLSGLNATTMSSNIVNATLGAYQRTGKEMGKIAGTIASGAAIGGPIGATLEMAAGAAMTGLENSVDMANANREHISVNGGMSGLAAANCNVIPSITLVRPIAQNPDSFPHTIGHLVNKAATLSSLNGFTTCRNVDVTNVGQATDKEKAQLKKILENGFYA